MLELPIKEIVVFVSVVILYSAAAIKAIPLTGLFESMIVLTIVFGLVFLFFSIAIRQVWFGTIMVWIILACAYIPPEIAKLTDEKL